MKNTISQHFIDEVFEEIIKITRPTPLDYVPDSLEAMLEADYDRLKHSMMHDAVFFNATIGFCCRAVDALLETITACAEDYADEDEERWGEIYEHLKSATNVDDILNSGYFFDDYELSRKEFANMLLSDFLYNI